MPAGASGDPNADVHGLAYTFGILVLGIVGILVGVVLVRQVPASIGGAVIVTGYVLVYVGFLGSLYLDLRGDGSGTADRPFDGESG